MRGQETLVYVFHYLGANLQDDSQLWIRAELDLYFYSKVDQCLELWCCPSLYWIVSNQIGTPLGEFVDARVPVRSHSKRAPVVQS